MSGSPIKGSINYGRNDINLNIDEQTFAKQINKTTPVGIINRKKYVVVCNGKGIMGFDLLQSQKKQIEDMAELHKKGYLTDEEFRKKKHKILGIDDDTDPA